MPSSGCIAEHWPSRVGWPTGAAWPSDGVTKTLYYAATSLDGYIADEHNCLDWLFDVHAGGGDDDSFRRFFADVGAMAMGATTFEWVLDHDRLLDRPEKWHVYYGETPCWAFTHRTLPPVPGADIRFVAGRRSTGSPGDDARGGGQERLARRRRRWGGAVRRLRFVR